METNVDIRMARLEEKVENIKDNLDKVVNNKLPEIEKKIDDISKYVHIGLGLAIAVQILIGFIEKML